MAILNTHSHHLQSQHDSLDEVIKDTDVLYVTRVQKERFSDVVSFTHCSPCYY